jgi:precorrin-3B C17-methyltransferase
MNKLIVAGFGPGDEKNMTAACRAALEEADIIAGYTAYIELIRPLYPHKKLLATAMKSEIERCKESLRLASEGRTVCLVSSGDSGVYGMASPAYEIAENYPDVCIEVIPGITAALSGAALLGAPLGHDFTVISLSDLLTPWELIEKRLRFAAAGDFVISIYNPQSHGRNGYINKACAILLEVIEGERVCGIANHTGREGESYKITSLEKLGKEKIDMQTTVFIGNSRTKNINGKMVTPRGYR